MTRYCAACGEKIGEFSEAFRVLLVSEELIDFAKPKSGVARRRR